MLRARQPDETGFVERNGIRSYWERFGEGDQTILFLPTWSIIHSRHWKFQIPYFARHFRVVTFDGRGNGRSDRPADAAAYAEAEFAADALAVLDATATERAATLKAARLGERRVWFSDGWHPTPIYARDRLPRDAAFEGPAILEQLDCTTVIEPGDRLAQDKLGNLLITVAP